MCEHLRRTVVLVSFRRPTLLPHRRTYSDVKRTAYSVPRLDLACPVSRANRQADTTYSRRINNSQPATRLVELSSATRTLRARTVSAAAVAWPFAIDEVRFATLVLVRSYERTWSMSGLHCTSTVLVQLQYRLGVIRTVDR